MQENNLALYITWSVPIFEEGNVEKSALIKADEINLQGEYHELKRTLTDKVFDDGREEEKRNLSVVATLVRNNNKSEELNVDEGTFRTLTQQIHTLRSFKIRALKGPSPR